MEHEISQLRHLYANMVNGAVKDSAAAKRIAEGLLSPVIERLERLLHGDNEPMKVEAQCVQAKCDTSKFCSSVQRCTARDADRAKKGGEE